MTFCYKFRCVFISGVCDLWILEGITNAIMVHVFQAFCQGKFIGGGILAVQIGNVK